MDYQARPASSYVPRTEPPTGLWAYETLMAVASTSNPKQILTLPAVWGFKDPDECFTDAQRRHKELEKFYADPLMQDVEPNFGSIALVHTQGPRTDDLVRLPDTRILIPTGRQHIILDPTGKVVADFSDESTRELILNYYLTEGHILPNNNQLLTPEGRLNITVLQELIAEGKFDLENPKFESLLENHKRRSGERR